MDIPPSGWYPDPYGVPRLLRWWDGSGWTEHTQAFEAAVGAAQRGGAGQRSPEPATSLDMPAVAAARLTQSSSDLPPATSLDLPPERGDSTRLDLQATFDAPPGNATRVFSRDEYQGYAQAMGLRQRRRRRWVMGLLSFGTVAVLGLMALALLHYIQQPPKQTVALNTAPAVNHTTAPPPSASPTPAATPAGSVITDSSAGLSYTLLPSPWEGQCPQGLNQTFSWTAGESAVAGQVAINGQQTPWYGSACSGPLPAQSGYNGVQDLLNTTQNLANTFESHYYAGVQSTPSQVVSMPLQVSGHSAWEIKFLMTYPAGASQGMTWSNELGAVVVVDLGTGQAPAVFYVSMPGNLDENNVDSLVRSLQIPASTASPPAATGSPAAGNNP
jgi:Protein of unknown function (DUF2510)